MTLSNFQRQGLSSGDAMTPAELEQHIKSCGYLVEQSMQRYAVSSNFSDRGDADYWRMKMEKASKARTPETIAIMEEQRGLE